MLQQVVEAYGCSLVEGVLSHQLKQFVIDGNKCVLNKVALRKPIPVPWRCLVSCCIPCTEIWTWCSWLYSHAASAFATHQA